MRQLISIITTKMEICKLDLKDGGHGSIELFWILGRECYKSILLTVSLSLSMKWILPKKVKYLLHSGFSILMQFIRGNSTYKITIYILEEVEVKAEFIQKIFFCIKMVFEHSTKNSLKEMIYIQNFTCYKNGLNMEEGI